MTNFHLETVLILSTVLLLLVAGSSASPTGGHYVSGAAEVASCPESDGCGFGADGSVLKFWVNLNKPDSPCRPLCASAFNVHYMLSWFDYSCGMCPDPVTATSYRLVRIAPHDASAFTQGLVLTEDGNLFEGTGLRGRSSIRKVHLLSGNITRIHDLDDKYFGEGIAHYFDEYDRERLIQLTWKLRTGFIYDTSLKLLEEFTFSTFTNEGWGITYVPAEDKFLVSDGSDYLHWWDAHTRAEVGRVRVVNGATSVTRLNELEWDPFTETVLANIWLTDVIVRIDPVSGIVLRQYDLKRLFTNRPPGTNVLNGIAWTDQPDEIWVTGKLWPHMFQIRLIDY